MQHYLVCKTQEMKNIEHMRINMMVNGMPSKEYKDSWATTRIRVWKFIKKNSQREKLGISFYNDQSDKWT